MHVGPPPFQRKAEVHCFWLSVVRCVVRGAWFRIFSRYLVPLTPPTVFVRSFWNLTGAFKMVWRYACGSPVFSKKSGGTLFSAFRVRGAWFRIFSRYLVPLTPPTVFVRSFRNLTGAFKIVWRYACVFFFYRILKLFFYHFLHILNLDIFWVLILQKSIDSRYIVPLNPSTGFGRSFETLYGLLGWSEYMHVDFSESWNNFLSLFSHF